MHATTNLQLARQFLAKLGAGASPDEMAALCAPDFDWNIPGDTGVLPWIGQQQGPSALADFVRDTSRMIRRVSLDIDDILASETRAVIVGRLVSRVNASGKLITTAFAIVLTFTDGKLASFLMLEDSYATSQAARPAS